jgi:hypothetical protein
LNYIKNRRNQLLNLLFDMNHTILEVGNYSLNLFDSLLNYNIIDNLFNLNDPDLLLSHWNLNLDDPINWNNFFVNFLDGNWYHNDFINRNLYLKWDNFFFLNRNNMWLLDNMSDDVVNINLLWNLYLCDSNSLLEDLFYVYDFFIGLISY